MGAIVLNDADLPLVSIITPSFNQGGFLDETIRSVLDQDYPRIEHIVIDGGSTDDSVEVIRRYEDRLAYWESAPDRGQADAVNKGLRRATGEIIGWLNSDDLFTKGALRAAVEALLGHPDAAVVYTDFDGLDQATGRMRRHRVWPADFPILLKGNCIPQPTAFFRRGVLDRIGYLNEDLHVALDWEFWLRVAEHGRFVYLPGRSFAILRDHADAKAHSLSTKRGMDYLRVLDSFYKRPGGVGPEAAKVRRQAYGRAYWFMAKGAIDEGQVLPEGARWLWRSLSSHPWHAGRQPLTSMRMVATIGSALIARRIGAQQESA